MRQQILIAVVVATALAKTAVTQVVTEVLDSSSQQSTNLAALTSKVALEALRNDWEKFDKSTGVEAQTFMAVTVHPQWIEQITPPFPNVWPPAKVRSISYYAYAQYGVALGHGPTISYSAPWARIELRAEREPIKKIYRTSIGEVVWSRVSEIWSAEHAQRYNEIQRSGERGIPAFLSWTRVPAEGDAAVWAIRDYYCQWKSDMGSLAATVMDNHREFNAWLACAERAPADRGIPQ